IATGLVSIAWLNPAKGKSNEAEQKKVSEKKQLNSAPRKDVTTAIDYVVEPSNTKNNGFQHQLDCVTAVDTAILEMPAPPPPPTPPAPNTIPTPAPTPMAPLSPLKGELSSPPPPPPPAYSYNYNYSFNKTCDSTPVTVTSKVNVNTANKVKSSVYYNSDTQLDKEEIRKQIKEAQRSIQIAMKQLNEVDMKKVQAEIQAVTKNINWQDLSAETRKAQAESIAALKNIDWTQISKAQAEATAALKNIDFQSLSKNLALAYSNLNVSDQVRKQLEDARQMAGNAQEYSSSQLEEVRKQRAEALEDAARARKEAAKTREESSGVRLEAKKMAAEQAQMADQAKKVAAEQKQVADSYRDMLRKMEADNLLDTQKDYSIEKNDKGLFINGVKQSDAVANKYSKYLKAKHVAIKGSANTYNTNVEN
ncbi:MAG TPA: hypothetical protein VIP81_13555, partial [Chitinophaga sp.]